MAITKGPYLLYHGDNTKMTVKWQLDGTAAGLIEWGLTTGYGSSQATSENSSSSNEHIHTYEIPSLTPGSLYYYKVTSETVEYTGSFTAAPADDVPCRFVTHGDSHAEIANIHNRCCKSILDKMNLDTSYKTMLIHIGDWISLTQTESTWNSAYFNRSDTDAVALHRQVPVIPCRGNHDDLTLLRKYYPMDFVDANFYYSFNYGNALIIVLDIYATYTTGSDQNVWLIAQLVGTSKTHKIIVMHDPPYHDQGHHAEVADMATDLVPVFETYGVSMVISGHNHYFCRSRVNGIDYYNVTPNGGALNVLDGDGTGVVARETGWTFGTVSLAKNGYDFKVIRARDYTLNTTQEHSATAFDLTSSEIVTTVSNTLNRVSPILFGVTDPPSTSGIPYGSIYYQYTG
jgi:predicted phosphodiesterase